MASYDLSGATTTNFTDNVPDFIVESKNLDVANDGNEESYVYFGYAPECFGYYFNHPQVSSPINSLATWTVSRGWTTEDKLLEQELKHVTGMG